MSAADLFRDGRLGDAIAHQNQQVKAKPSDPDERFMLYVLLCWSGDLERAEKQLDVMDTQDDQIKTGALVYRALLASELERRLVYEGKGRPQLPPNSAPYVEKRIEALGLARQGDYGAAEAAIEAAVEATPAHTGTLDGNAFSGIRDYDDVLGTVLEVFAGGRYLWLPYEHVRSLELAEFETALDTLWRPADLVDADGTSARIHLPALYAGSAADEDEGVRLGRRTEWLERGDLYQGAGQRTLLTASGEDTQEHAFLDVRKLEIAG